MIKKLLVVLFVQLVASLGVFAYQDCLVTTNGKLTEIRIKDHNIIDVFPLITLMNDKNTLIVTPLHVGETEFSVVKNGKNVFVFNVKVKPHETIIDEVKGFDILTIDGPPEVYEYELDFPPVLKEFEES